MGNPRKKAPAKAAQVAISLRHGSEVFESTGATITEALKALQGPTKITAKGFLKVTRGGKRFDRFFGPIKLRQFLRPAYLAIQAKQIEPYLQ